MLENAQQPFRVTVPHRSTYSTIVIGDITFKKLMSIRSPMHAIDFMNGSGGEDEAGGLDRGSHRALPLHVNPLKKLILGRQDDSA